MTRCEPIRDGAWWYSGVLTQEECEELQRLSVEQGMADYRADERLRVMERVEIDVPELAATVWQRISPLIPERVVVDGSDDSRRIGLPADDPNLHGVWRPLGLNPYLRVAKYPGNGRGHFGPHRDGAYEVSLTERSLLTLNGYLAEVPEGCGGRTRFLVDGLELHQDEATGRFVVKDEAAAVTHSVRPQAGCAVVFYHGLMHDGEPLREGAPPKWIFRFDIMFRREGPAPSPLALTARRLETEADGLEREQPMLSMELSRLALKLREGRVKVEEAQARGAALLGRQRLLEGAVDTDVWKPAPEEAEEAEAEAAAAEEVELHPAPQAALDPSAFIGRPVKELDAAMRRYLAGEPWTVG